MKLITPLELAGKLNLEFDIYNAKGELLFKKGDPITPGMILEWNTNKESLYRAESKFSIEDFDVEPTSISDKENYVTVFSEKTKKTLISNSKNLMQSIVDGESINMKACTETQKVLVGEVSEKIDKIKGINELRVFDKYTFSHTVNVSTMSTALGMLLNLSEEEINELSFGAMLHDVGKMLIPKEILFKPGKLEPEEFEIIKTHTTKGYEYIMAKNEIPDKIAKVALEHQEKYSGIGYPYGLKNDEIGYYAQIVAIIDVYDALVSERVYKKGMPTADALRLMMSDGSKSFNPAMLYRFVYIANNREKTNLINN